MSINYLLLIKPIPAFDPLRSLKDRIRTPQSNCSLQSIPATITQLSDLLLGSKPIDNKLNCLPLNKFPRTSLISTNSQRTILSSTNSQRTLTSTPLSSTNSKTPTTRNYSTMIQLPIEVYISRSWLRQHLYYLGHDLIRLQTYQKLSKNFGSAGGLLKSVVSDISSFINNSNAKELTNLIDFIPNKDLLEFSNKSHNISDCRLFFMIIGYMLLHNHNSALDRVVDRVIENYLNSRSYSFDAVDTDSFKSKVLTLANDYYTEAPINYEMLFSNTTKDISLYITKHIKIKLPDLPRINNKVLLTKSLMHKELYRGLTSKTHRFHDILMANGITPDREIHQIIRNDLSYSDGLGDYYLSRESSNLLYLFTQKQALNEVSFGKKSYTLLKTILITNSLFSRLAVAYNLHRGLDDPIVYKMLVEDYVPGLNEWKDIDLDINNDVKQYRYEQEFIADYFEQYVGSLVIEQPEVAKAWINEIYSNVLNSIGEEHKLPSRSIVQYDYHSWGVDVIGRKIR